MTNPDGYSGTHANPGAVTRTSPDSAGTPGTAGGVPGTVGGVPGTVGGVVGTVAGGVAGVVVGGVPGVGPWFVRVPPVRSTRRPRRSAYPS